MWESLATTRRQDRVLHGLAKALNLVAGIVLTPVWLVGQRVVGPVRRALGWFERREGPLSVPLPAEPSMDALMADLRAIPHSLKPDPGAMIRKGLKDWAGFILSQTRATVNLGYSYPAQFGYHTFPGADGERIAAQVALHGRPRPALIVVHGLFSSRLFDYVREVAVRAYFDWGFNVAVVDLRSFGATELTSHAPSTAGWKEGEDLVACGRWMKEMGSTSAGALGISLGASSVLNATHPEGADEALDGGALAICGPADTRDAVAYISRKVPRSHPFYPVNRLFHAMLVTKVRSVGWPASIADFNQLIEQVVAPHYGSSVEEIYARSSAVNHVSRARVPLLVLHAEDDVVVPVHHARLLEEAAGGNPNVRVWVVPGGGHAAFDAVDPRWTWSVYRGFFERWARYPGPEGAVPAAPAAGTATA